MQGYSAGLQNLSGLAGSSQQGQGLTIPGVNVPGINLQDLSPYELGMLTTLGQINTHLDKLEKRLAPTLNFLENHYNSLALLSSSQIQTGGLYVNGFIGSVVQGTMYVFFGAESSITPASVPDLIFLSGTPTVYVPITPEQMDSVTIYAAGTANLIATLIIMSY